MTGQTVAILPVKLLALAKQRLASELSDSARAQLMTAMLADVASVLRATASIDLTVLVTRDDRVAALAPELGLELLTEPPSCDSHSAAAHFGASWAASHQARRVICCAADCPLVSAQELDRLLERCDHERIEFAVVPDRAGTGTNALVISPPTACKPAFGPGSRARHIEHAKALGIRAQVTEVPSLSLDVDAEQDLHDLGQVLACEPALAPETAAALREIEGLK